MVHARNITGYNDPLRKATKNHSEGCNVTKVDTRVFSVHITAGQM